MGRLFDTKTDKPSTTPVKKGRLFAEPIGKQPSTLSKVAKGGKEMALSMGRAVTMPSQRVAQLAATTMGVSPKKIEAGTQKAFGKLATPMPQTGGDVLKDVGRGMQIPLLAAPMGTIPQAMGLGALQGLGSTLEQGVSPVSKEGIKDIAVSTAVSAALPIAGKVLTKIPGKVVTREITDEAAALAAKERAPYTVPEVGVPPVTPTIVPKTVDEANNLRVFGTKERPTVKKGKIVPPAQKAVSEAKTAKGAVPKATVPKSPEYIKSVEDRAQKIAAKDPEFNPSSDATKIVKFDEVSSTVPKEQMVKWGTGLDRNTPEGLPATVIRGLLEEDMLANPAKYTHNEIFRISTSAVRSEAGAALQGVKVKTGQIVDTPMDFIRKEQAKLQEKIKAERLITKSAIRRFLDELPVCTI